MSLAQSMNLDSVMAHLSRMSPQQLQQFAAMHKEDPIMLAAASSIKNRMDKMQQSGQGAQGPQPPVNEQVVQSMNPQGMPPQGPQGPQGMPQASQQLPEQQGIGALPAPNMQSMAGGGIVAFADGGFMDEEPVERYQSGGLLGDIQGYVPGPPRAQLPQTGNPDKTVWEKYGAPLFDKYQVEQARQSTLRRAREAGDTRPETDILREAGLRDETAARGADVQKLDTLRSEPYVAPAAAAAQKAPPPAANTAARPGAVQPVISAPKQDLAATLQGFMPKDLVDPLAAQREAVTAARTTAAKEAVSEVDTGLAKQGDAFKTREARIGQRESELGKQKDVNTNMALIEAGLAMMQSSGRGLSGIAAGAATGTKAYASGIERLRAAQEKLDEARDRTEELRLNYDTMNARERRALTNEARNVAVKGKEDTLAGLQAALGINEKKAATLLEATVKTQEGALDRASREKIANAPSGQMQLLSSLGGKGGIEAGLRLLTDIQSGKRSIEQSYEDYMKAFAGKDTALNPPLSPQQYVSQIKMIRTAMEPNKVPGVVDAAAPRS